MTLTAIQPEVITSDIESLIDNSSTKYASSVVYNMDCITGMKKYPDKFFDLAIVDPPYGIGDNWSKSRKDTFYKKGRLHKYQNKQIPKKDYYIELFRCSKNQILWGGNYFTKFLPPVNSWLIWDKDRDYEKTFMSEVEMAWTSFSRPAIKVKLLWDGARKCEKAERIHPHQKPVMLYDWIIEKYCKPGFKILDTHMGSGSSRIAANKADLEYVGFELDKHYFNESEKRFKKFISQTRLF